jgi:hypothetical protein
MVRASAKLSERRSTATPNNSGSTDADEVGHTTAPIQQADDSNDETAVA